MMNLTINGKEYNIEFTIEASLYNECTEKVVNLMTNIMTSAENENIKDMISSMSDVPQTTLTMFYAGLLENHSDEIQSIADAKVLIKKLMKENEQYSNFYDIMQGLMECMSDDGFFKQIGLEQMMSEDNQTEKVTKMPQDHKKKTTTKKKTEVGEK